MWSQLKNRRNSNSVCSLNSQWFQLATHSLRAIGFVVKRWISRLCYVIQKDCKHLQDGNDSIKMMKKKAVCICIKFYDIVLKMQKQPDYQTIFLVFFCFFQPTSRYCTKVADLKGLLWDVWNIQLMVLLVHTERCLICSRTWNTPMMHNIS